MRMKNKDIMTLGILLLIFGIGAWVIPLPFVNAHTFLLVRAIVTTVTLVLVVSGVVFIVIAIVNFSRDGKQDKLDHAAAISTQAQAEYHRKLSALCGDAAADELTQAKLFAQAVQMLALEAPSTAVFAPLNEMTVAEDSGTYAVSGWVDSQNGYGVMIRTHFTIAVFKANGTWHVRFS